MSERGADGVGWGEGGVASVLSPNQQLRRHRPLTMGPISDGSGVLGVSAPNKCAISAHMTILTQLL